MTQSFSAKSFNFIAFILSHYSTTSFTDLSFKADPGRAGFKFKTFIDSINVGEEFNRSNPDWPRIELEF